MFKKSPCIVGLDNGVEYNVFVVHNSLYSYFRWHFHSCRLVTKKKKKLHQIKDKSATSVICVAEVVLQKSMDA